jgi:hypothetical protein
MRTLITYLENEINLRSKVQAIGDYNSYIYRSFAYLICCIIEEGENPF